MLFQHTITHRAVLCLTYSVPGYLSAFWFLQRVNMHEMLTKLHHSPPSKMPSEPFTTWPMAGFPPPCVPFSHVDEGYWHYKYKTKQEEQLENWNTICWKRVVTADECLYLVYHLCIMITQHINNYKYWLGAKNFVTKLHLITMTSCVHVFGFHSLLHMKHECVHSQLNIMTCRISPQP